MLDKPVLIGANDVTKMTSWTGGTIVSDGYYDGSGDFVIDKKDKTKGRIRLDNRAIIVNPATETSSTSRGVTGGATHITLALENKTVENQLGFFNSTRQWGGVGNHLGAHSNGLGVDEW
jgi:ribosomal protein S19